MLSRRFLAMVFGAATLSCAAGLAIAPGAASAGVVAGGRAVPRPAAASIPSPGGPIRPAVTPGPVTPGGPAAQTGSFSQAEASVNWSGYAVTSARKFTYAQSRFVQPSLTCPGDHPNEWASNWVGLDGYNNSTVEQDGTAMHCGGPASTRPVYKAWYEMYPANSVNVFSVSPGDVISTSVSYSNGKFTLTVSDLTTHQSASHTASCASCQRASAEWIIERPALCSSRTDCFLTRLADFGTVTMSAKARVAGDGSALGIPDFRNYSLTMVTSGTNGTPLDTIGKVGGGSFPASWDGEGTTIPLG